MDEEDRKKEALRLYKKYYALFTDDFQFTIGSSSVIVKHVGSFYPIPFANESSLKTLKKLIKLKLPKQKV